MSITDLTSREPRNSQAVGPSPWAAVALLWVAFFLNYVDRQAAFAIFPVLQRDLGFTPVQLGLIGTVFIWTYALAMPPAGRLADLFSFPKLIVASLILWSLAMMGTAGSPSVNFFLSWRVVMGATEALYFPAAVALITTLHGNSTRSRALAIHQSAQLVGGAVGTSLGGWMADHTGWRMGFSLLGATGIAYAGILHFSLRRLPKAAASSRKNEGSALELFHSLRMNLLLLSFFFFCGLLWMIYAWLPSHVYEKFRLSMTSSGGLTALSLQGSSLVGMLVGGYLGDKLGRRIMVACTGLILSPALAYFVFASDKLSAAMIAAAAFGLTAGLFQANVFAGAYDLIPDGSFGFASGVLNAVGGIAGGLGILFAGLFRDSIGIAVVVGITGALTITAGIALLLAELKRGARFSVLARPSGRAH